MKERKPMPCHSVRTLFSLGVMLAFACACALAGAICAPAPAYADVTEGWNAFGTCEWKVTDHKVLVIRPAGNGETGLLDNFEFKDDGAYPAPWHDLFNAELEPYYDEATGQFDV